MGSVLLTYINGNYKLHLTTITVNTGVLGACVKRTSFGWRNLMFLCCLGGNRAISR